MKLGKLACLIDKYTNVDTICITLNGKVLALHDRKDLYIKITSELEKVEVSKYYLDGIDNIYMVILDVNSFKSVFKI